MKNLFTFTLLVFSYIGISQEIKFKNKFVTIDGKECLKYETDYNNETFQNLNGDDIIILKYIRVNDKLYTKVYFVETRQELTSQNFIFTRKVLIDRLIKSNTLVDCTLNQDKVNTFVLKYDEKVEDRLKNNNTNTVIIKEEPRSGININLGR